MIIINIIVGHLSRKDVDFYAYSIQEYFRRGLFIATKVGATPEYALFEQYRKYIYMVSKKELLGLFKKQWGGNHQNHCEYSP